MLQNYSGFFCLIDIQILECTNYVEFNASFYFQFKYILKVQKYDVYLIMSISLWRWSYSNLKTNLKDKCTILFDKRFSSNCLTPNDRSYRFMESTSRKIRNCFHQIFTNIAKEMGIMTLLYIYIVLFYGHYWLQYIYKGIYIRFI